MGHRVLVTGGGGFIGGHLVRLLRWSGVWVRVFDRCPPPDDTPHQVQWITGDLADPDAVRRAVEGCAVVLHLAANPNLWACDRDEFDRTNHRGTRHVLQAATAAGVSRLVHVSTESILTSAHGPDRIDESTRTGLSDQVGPYCRSKWRAEAAAMEACAAGLPVVVVSPTIPVGPGDVHRGPLTRLIGDFAAGRIRGRVNAELDLVDVRDVAEALWAAAQRGAVGRRYLIAGETWSVAQLFDELAALTGRPAPRLEVPYGVALAFAHAEQWWCRLRGRSTPMATVTGVRLSRRSMRFDGSLSRGELNVRRRPVRAALAEAVAWLRERGAAPALDALRAPAP